jgi:two-component system OmpR family sensor kinase
VGTPATDESEPADLARIASQEVAVRNQAHESPPAGAGRPLQLEGDSPVMVTLSPVETSQLVGNLLDNALLHGRPPVHVRVDQINHLARLQVQDDGPGMDPELLATATRRFTRAPESRAKPGFGLGLSLVAASVSRAEGQLRLCYAGQHEVYGAPMEVDCDHGPEMTATVLLPSR